MYACSYVDEDFLMFEVLHIAVQKSLFWEIRKQKYIYPNLYLKEIITFTQIPAHII